MKKSFFTLLLSLLSLQLFSYEVPVKEGEELVVIKTSMGQMVFAFWSESAPDHVKNFKKLVQQGFYDGTTFHRIIRGFVAQGGDPLSKTNDPNVGTGGPGYTVNAEFNDKHHKKGVLSMARGADPNSAGSQFFIVLDEAGFLDNKYTAFGYLVDGSEVLDRLGKVPVQMNRFGEMSSPIQKVVLESATLIVAGKPAVSQSLEQSEDMDHLDNPLESEPMAAQVSSAPESSTPEYLASAEKPPRFLSKEMRRPRKPNSKKKHELEKKRHEEKRHKERLKKEGSEDAAEEGNPEIFEKKQMERHREIEEAAERQRKKAARSQYSQESREERIERLKKWKEEKKQRRNEHLEEEQAARKKFLQEQAERRKERREHWLQEKEAAKEQLSEELSSP